jgi:hypothetical protein
MQYLYISYPDNDYQFAHRLVEDLQRAGYAVFVDAVAEAGTMPWAAETRHAIRSCSAMLMILSPAEGRRVGIRHEGILANRRRKPVYVLRRSEGDLPRYLQRATVIDFSGEFEPAFQQLEEALPDAATLLNAPDPTPQYRPRRPPRQPNRTRRRMMWALAWGAMLVVCLALLGIALGVIPV